MDNSPWRVHRRPNPASFYPFHAPHPGFALVTYTLQPFASLTSPSWGTLSHPFYMLKSFCSLSPLMHDASLNFPDSSNHHQQSHHNTARNQITCRCSRCPNQYSILELEENSATEDNLIKKDAFISHPLLFFFFFFCSEYGSSWWW